MVIGSRIRVLEPTQEAEVTAARLAPRLESLHGKTIGLYSNNKLNATKLLDMAEAILRERYAIKGVVRGAYQVGRIMRPDEWIDVERCDAVVLTHGD